MSFTFRWENQFSQSFIQKTKSLMTGALNKGKLPSLIADKIVVTELDLGSVPPDLEMLEIVELTFDKFKGIFRISYSGNAFLILQSKVQANPLTAFNSSAPSFTNPTMLAANSSLTVPMFVKLSDLKINGVVILAMSKTSGVTMVFRNDPLHSVRVSSSFDSISAIESYLQREIEKHLSLVLRDELPSIIHHLSLDWGKKNIINSLSDASHANTSAFSAKHSTPIGSTLYEELTEPMKVLEISPESKMSSANILRMATLETSQKTLSPFTFSISNSICRASNSSSPQYIDNNFKNQPISPNRKGKDLSRHTRKKNRFKRKDAERQHRVFYINSSDSQISQDTQSSDHKFSKCSDISTRSTISTVFDNSCQLTANIESECSSFFEISYDNVNMNAKSPCTLNFDSNIAVFSQTPFFRSHFQMDSLGKLT